MASFISFFGLRRLFKEKDHPNTFQLGTIPFVSFYFFLDIGIVTYEKDHLWGVFKLFSIPLIKKKSSSKLGSVHARKSI